MTKSDRLSASQRILIQIPHFATPCSEWQLLIAKFSRCKNNFSANLHFQDAMLNIVTTMVYFRTAVFNGGFLLFVKKSAMQVKNCTFQSDFSKNRLVFSANLCFPTAMLCFGNMMWNKRSASLHLVTTMLHCKDATLNKIAVRLCFGSAIKKPRPKEGRGF